MVGDVQDQLGGRHRLAIRPFVCLENIDTVVFNKDDQFCSLGCPFFYIKVTQPSLVGSQIGEYTLQIRACDDNNQRSSYM